MWEVLEGPMRMIGTNNKARIYIKFQMLVFYAVEVICISVSATIGLFMGLVPEGSMLRRPFVYSE